MNSSGTTTTTPVPRSITDSIARLPVWSVLMGFLVFTLVTVGSVFLVNWIMKRCERVEENRQQDEELTALAPSHGDRTAASDPPSEGNSSRQKFLQQRREAAQKQYGTTS